MANQEQLEILKQGVDVWNRWREDNPVVEVDFVGADLNGINLENANLRNVNLSQAELIGANFHYANLRDATLSKANLGGAFLVGTNLIEAILSETNLSEALLWQANLSEAQLWKTNFCGADLSRANLNEANLWGANFKETVIGATIFRKLNLSETCFLEEVRHLSPSTIGTDTLQLSIGKIPDAFLRGCGLSDWEIESAKLYNPDLTNEEIVKIQYRMFDLRATQALQISPLFISYSHTDKPFVDHLDSSLTKKGIRFWRDIHDATAGRLETQIDRAIRQNPTVLLILSKNSIKSDWVEHEVRKARELEKELGRDALCPIALDDGWKSSPWPERVMEQVMEYNILDFSGWQDQPTFESKFAKLLSGLDLFYKKSK